MERDDKRKAVAELKALVRAGQEAQAWEKLCAVAEPGDDLPLQASYARLAAGLPQVVAAAQPLRLGLLASSTVDHLEPALRFWLLREGFRLESQLAPFDTIRQTVLDGHSPLYAFAPELVWLFTSHRDVSLEVAPGAAPEAVLAAVQARAAETRALWQALKKRSPAFVVQNNADLPAERALGNFEGQVPWSRANLLRAWNLELARGLPSGVALFDLDALSAHYGRARFCDPRFWHHSKHAFAPDATGLVAFRAARLFAAWRGRAKKVAVVDLDNTLWGGVVGDDGVEGLRLGPGGGAEGEAFAAFQAHLKALKQRGVVLAVSSKNERAAAEAPFREHPHMALELEDFASFRANWDNKADNLRAIAQALNLGLDAFVFLDDNPAERALVRRELPQVAVPELPPDPCDWVQALDQLALFETTSFSEEDQERGQLYRDNAVRDQARAQFTDLSEFLQSLEMVAEVGPLDAPHLPRMAQLVNKSNQFHLTGTRYSESQLDALARDPARRVRWFKLKDRFGDNGLISVVVLEKQDGAVAIDTWVMSCRVLSRGMEEFIAQEVVREAQAWGCGRVVGRYVPSKKNQLVAGLYQRLGFLPRAQEATGATTWELDWAAAQPKWAPHIRREEAKGA